MTTTNQVPPLDESVDHVRGPSGAPVILEYGDYECPYSRLAYREIERVESGLGGQLRFAFRHFPLTQIHPHALAASAATEAAALQGNFWQMHQMLFGHQKALEDDDLRGYAADLDVDAERFEGDRVSDPVLQRVARDMQSGIDSGVVRGTPTLFINGALHRGTYDADALLDALGM